MAEEDGTTHNGLSAAQAWLIYRITGSGALLGVLGFVGQIPIFVLSPLAGLAADRWPRRRVVIATQTVSMLLAFILAALTMTRHILVWEIIVLATLLGIVNAFDVPARQSFLIEMVGREDLLNAIALNSSMFNGARVAGPAIAGIVVALVGEGWCFLLNGISYLAWTWDTWGCPEALVSSYTGTPTAWGATFRAHIEHLTVRRFAPVPRPA